MMEDTLKDKWWETAIEMISEFCFHQIESSSVEYIVRKIQIILKNDDLDAIINKVKPLVGVAEDNVGVVAKVIFDVLGEKELMILRDKVAKNYQFCDYMADLANELDLKNEALKDELSKKDKEADQTQ